MRYTVCVKLLNAYVPRWIQSHSKSTKVEERKNFLKDALKDRQDVIKNYLLSFHAIY